MVKVTIEDRGRDDFAVVVDGETKYAQLHTRGLAEIVAAHYQRPDPIAILKDHTPSITQDMDDGVGRWADLEPRDEMGDYVGDTRVCHCGEVVEGFYDYVEHLKKVLA